ncbi:MAG: hypothetical protein NT029_04870 [Armatimonadetes bacterium]|nr:hypothetical protein [Armatimonadota bacterium]
MYKNTQWKGSRPVWVAGAATTVVLAAVMVVAQTRRETVTSTPRRAGAQPQATVRLPAAKPGRSPLEFYVGAVRGDLFTSPQASAPLPAPVPVVKPLPPPPAPVVVDPFADMAYTGTVTIGGQTLAVVENTKTKEGQFARKGDSVVGGTVTDITDRTLTVSVSGVPRTLTKTEDYKLVSLDKNAAFLSAQPGQPGAPPPLGAPGAMPAPAAAPGISGLPADLQERIRRRMQGMTPEQMQEMRNRWMNRQFDGQGRGGRGRG